MKNISKLPVKYNGEIVGYTEDEGKTIKFIKETDTLSYDMPF